MKRFFRENRGLLLLCALLLTGVLWALSVLGGGSLLSAVVNLLVTPFRSASGAVAGWVEEGYDYAFRYEELLRELEAVKERNAQLEAAARAGEDAVREADRLRDLMGLAERRADFEMEAASIVMRTSSSWQATVTLNKGIRQGVAQGDCVVDQYGNLVGVVRSVDFNSCLVATVVDAELELGGRVARTDADAVLEGDFTLMLEGRLKLSYLPADTELIAGDQIVTSGVGMLYPAGLVVGAIRSVHTEADGLGRYAVVEPTAHLDELKYVYIIKEFEVVE
ncbi:MAG: rod shape-determining protein MreC [Oscillospiraceae bacterium]|nr:rod shape-determining protein MreC [Oscillospiraceae bacterium]